MVPWVLGTSPMDSQMHEMSENSNIVTLYELDRMVAIKCI